MNHLIIELGTKSPLTFQIISSASFCERHTEIL